MKSCAILVALLGILLQCVWSIPSSFEAISLGKEVFNKSGVYGTWHVDVSKLHADDNQNCQFWKQSDKEYGNLYFFPTQHARKGWVEAYADASQVNGLGTGNFGMDDGVTLLSVTSEAWGNIGSLLLLNSTSSPTGVSGVIVVNWEDRKSTEFNIPSGFHRYTLGYDFETLNITVYVDDKYVTSFVADQFNGNYPYQFECGYSAGNNVLPKGTGKLYIKECNSFLPVVKSIYVDAAKGDDSNDGLSEKTPLKTIGAAASKAASGTTIYIADGIYRESFTSPSGNEQGYVKYLGTGDNVIMSGSVPVSSFSWTKDSNNIWSADVSSKILKAPIFVTYRKSNGEFERLIQARTPNYKVETPWKVTEFWNTAMGGKKIMSCFGQDDCDDSDDVNTLKLSDEAFKTMDNLVGAQIFMSDRISGHYYYNSTIVAHDKNAGTITTDKERLFDGYLPGLGMYSQYYVYGKKFMIDAEGEYAYENGKLYIKWSKESLPDSLEFSTMDSGLILTGAKYVKVENMHFMHYEKQGIFEEGGWIGSDSDSTYNVYITNCGFEYDNSGIGVTHGTTNAKSVAHDWRISYCSFIHNDASGLYLYGDGEREFPNVGIVNFKVTNNYFYDLGFRNERNCGIYIEHVRYFYFLNNTVRYVSHNGLQIGLTDSQNGEISTGSNLVRGNLFDGICSGNSDCGCVKIWSTTESHIWKNMLVTENLCQNTFGWTKTSYNRDRWYDRAFGGFGFFTDFASGPMFYRNIVYNVGEFGFTIFNQWEDGNQTMVVNNLIVGAPEAINVAGATKEQESHISILNNVIVDAAIFGFIIARDNYPTPFDKFDVNNNNYYHYGWSGGRYQAGVGVIQDSNDYWQVAHTFDNLHEIAPKWETTKYSFDPGYGSYKSCYNLSFDERHFVAEFDDGTFDVTSALVDKGTETLPKALKDLLKFFNIDDVKQGSRYDLGPYESGVGSWIPSSKKQKPVYHSSEDYSESSHNSDNGSDKSVVSLANSLYVSMSLLVVCLSIAFSF